MESAPTAAAIVTLTFRGIGAFLLIIGGLYAIRYGFQLFKDRIGLESEKGKLDFKVGKLRLQFSSATVGGLLMVTSSFWGTLGYLTMPRLAVTGANWQVTQNDTLIRRFAFDNASSELAGADRNSIANFATIAKKSIASDPNAKIVVLSEYPSDRPEIGAKRNETIIKELLRSGVDQSNIVTNPPSRDRIKVLMEFMKKELPALAEADNSSVVLLSHDWKT
jgi:hypothetical protein